ncbi:MAG TPA: hypothetical protein VGB92_09010 [Longimicrobium sp.]
MHLPFERIRILAVATLLLSAVACAALPPTVPRPSPPPAADTLASLVAGRNSACALTTSGDAYCWGETGGEALVRDGAALRLSGPGGDRLELRAVSTHGNVVCGITRAGTLQCSGLGERMWGQVAWDSTPRQCSALRCLPLHPTNGLALPPGPLRSVAVGWRFVCVQGAGVDTYCWGANDRGQLGSGEVVESEPPPLMRPERVVGGHRLAGVAAGSFLGCGVVEAEGEVWCWGYGYHAAPEDTAVRACRPGSSQYPEPCERPEPVRVRVDSAGGWMRAGEARFARVAVHGTLVCALSEDGVVHCWGDNYRCGLGRCRAPASAVARPVPLAGRAVDVGVGDRHACARTADGRIFCWGDNSHGQLGSLVSANAGPDGLPPDYSREKDDDPGPGASGDICFNGGLCSPAPVQVSPERRWDALVVSSSRACGLSRDDGRIRCWGGAETIALGGVKLRERCRNRSRQYPDVTCQATPVEVPGLPSFAARATAPPHAPRTSAAQVTVSRREVRVVFPPEPDAALGWSAREAARFTGYVWSVLVRGVEAPLSIGLRVQPRDGQPRAFRSLEELVATDSPAVCGAGMGARCDGDSLRAFVDGGRVVISLRDSAQVARLFGMRPPRVAVHVGRPGQPFSLRSDSVDVRYVEPQVAHPDAAAQAASAAARRRSQASITRIYHTIHGRSERTTLWVAVGDSVPLRVTETTCRYDVCTGGMEGVANSGWSIVGPGVARLVPKSHDSTSSFMDDFGPKAHLVGVRPGRTRVRVVGLTSGSDTVPSTLPPPRELEAEVRVTHPIMRVELLPADTLAVVGTPLPVRVRVVDAHGGVVQDALVRLTIAHGTYTELRDITGAGELVFRAPGIHVVAAEFGNRKAEMRVTVRSPP